MDLNELKIQLNTDAEKQTLSRDGLSELLKKNSTAIGENIKKSLRFEIAVSLLFGALCIYFAAIAKHWSLQLYLAIFGVVCFVFTGVLLILHRRVMKAEHASPSVGQNIQSVINIIETYTKYYFRFSIGLIPICIILSLSLSYSDPAVDKTIFTKTSFIVTFSLVMLAMSIGIWFVNKWYIKKLYGRYLKQLKKNLSELKSDETI